MLFAKTYYTAGCILQIAALSSVCFIASNLPTAAQSGGVEISAEDRRLDATNRFWNRLNMGRAEPYSLPNVENDTPAAPAASLAQTGKSVSHAGAAPTVKVPFTSADDRDAVTPIIHKGAGERRDLSAPNMISQPGYPFTTARAGERVVTRTYPWATIGKLFFVDAQGRNSWCSASVVSQRLLLTAGHCLYDQGQGVFHTQFTFYPAYDGTKKPVSPYCKWAWKRAIVPAEWAFGPWPSSHDFGLVQLRDKACKGQPRNTIGQWVGWLGWATNTLIGNHITEMGYPANLDGGSVMQQTNSEVRARDFGNPIGVVGEIGSAQSGGSSGGPWVQNFGVAPSGLVPIGSNLFTEPLSVVAVKSYGDGNHNAWQYGGASILNSVFVEIWDTACAWQDGNCD